MAKIYVLIDPTTNEARWVGKTSQKHLSSRLANICTFSRGNGTRRLGCHDWVAGLLAQGIYPEIHLLEEADDWVEAEQFWIAYLASLGARLTNISPGGDGAIGYVCADATREKLRIASASWVRTPAMRKRFSAAQKGKKKQPSHVEKIAASKRGKPLRDEHCANIAKALKGKPKPPRSPEHAAKIAAANRGRKQSPEVNEKRRATMLRRVASGMHRNQFGSV